MISAKKQKQIDEFLSQPVKIGDVVTVRGLGRSNKNAWTGSTEVIDTFEDGSILILEHRQNKRIKRGDYRKNTYNVGENPFPKRRERIQNINFALSSVLHTLGLTGDKMVYSIKGIEVKPCNFNPFVFDAEGNKQYYQRPLVWTDDDKRMLIDSIYNDVDCGKILVRDRSWQEIEKLVDSGETDIAWKDVIDGKQRLNAVVDFITGKFADSYGNYYADLSDQAQRRLVEHQLFSYAEMPENSTDDQVISQFLKLNFTGVPQSKEHIEFVKTIFGCQK